MDDQKVRNLGLLGGGAALVLALGMATLGGPKPPAPAPALTTTATATPSAGAVAPIPKSPEVETAMAGPPVAVPAPQAPSAGATAPDNPDLEFIVRFDDRHPLSRAQDLYLQGKHADAEASVRETLARRAEFTGLCFQRFTFGAEIVLATCAPVPHAQRRRTSDRWVRKLKAMRGVQYADANVEVQPERR